MVPLPETSLNVPDKSIHVDDPSKLYCILSIEPDPLVLPHIKVTDAEFTPGVATSELGPDEVALLYGLTETKFDELENPP